jgi:hypothetical protein
MQESNKTDNDGRARHDEGEATSFMRDEAGNPSLPLPAAPIAVRAFAMERQKPNNGAHLSRDPRKISY